MTYLHEPLRGSMDLARKPSQAAGGGASGNFLIFEDAENGGGDGGMEAPAPWESGTATENMKENSAKATAWNVNPPKQRGGGRSRAPRSQCRRDGSSAGGKGGEGGGAEGAGRRACRGA